MVWRVLRANGRLIYSCGEKDIKNKKGQRHTVSIIIVASGVIVKPKAFSESRRVLRGREDDLDGFAEGEHEGILCAVEIGFKTCTSENLAESRDLRRQVGDVVDLPDGLSGDLQVLKHEST